MNYLYGVGLSGRNDEPVIERDEIIKESEHLVRTKVGISPLGYKRQHNKSEPLHRTPMDAIDAFIAETDRKIVRLRKELVRLEKGIAKADGLRERVAKEFVATSEGGSAKEQARTDAPARTGEEAT